MITPDIILQPFAAQASSQDISVPPQTSPTGFVNFTDGYTRFYEINLAANNPQAKAVERGIMNYMFNALTKNAQAWQNQGFAAWYASKPGGYEQGAFVMRVVGGIMTPYRSLVQANVSDPLSTPAQWEYLPTAAEAKSAIPMPQGGANGPGAGVIRTATDLNSINIGTFEVQSDATAALCPNMPVMPGQAAKACLIESIAWTDALTAGNALKIQRVTDTAGNIFMRSAVNGTHTGWTIQVNNPYLQSGAMIYAVTTGIAPAYAASLTPSPGVLTDGMEIRVRFHAISTGASTFNLNGLGAKQLVGTAFSDIKAGTIAAGAVANLRYQSSGSGAWIMTSLVGGYWQAPAARNDDEVPNWGQVKTYVAGSAPTSIPWSIITGKPDIVYTGSFATLSAIELVSGVPYIDFHINSDASDFNVRLANDAEQVLSIISKSGGGAIASFGQMGSAMGRFVTLVQGAAVSYNQALHFFNSLGTQGYYIQANDTNWFLNYTPSNGAVAQTSVYMIRASGQLVFSTRPSFAGYVPWDNQNFNPANYLVKGANGATNGVTLSYANGTDIGNLTNAYQGSLQIENGSNGSAAISFLRVGIYGAYIGMAANNQPYWGGWSSKSDGTQGYLVTSYNMVAWLQLTYPRMAYYYVGAYALAIATSGANYNIGDLIDSTQMIFASVTGANYSVRPAAGTWRCMGASGNANLVTSITLWQRVV